MADFDPGFRRLVCKKGHQTWGRPSHWCSHWFEPETPDGEWIQCRASVKVDLRYGDKYFDHERRREVHPESPIATVSAPRPPRSSLERERHREFDREDSLGCGAAFTLFLGLPFAIIVGLVIDGWLGHFSERSGGEVDAETVILFAAVTLYLLYLKFIKGRN